MNAATLSDPRDLVTGDSRVQDQVSNQVSTHAQTRKGVILKYKADRLPVAYVLGTFGLHAALFFLAPTWLAALCVIPLAVVSMFVAAINHHHQHLNTFKSPILNRLYELTLSLQAGVGPFAWVLHHNLGHHRNYLNQRPHAESSSSGRAACTLGTYARCE